MHVIYYLQRHIKEAVLKILMVHKFLYETAGAEAYMLRLGEYFQSIGHEVQYFGMEDKRNIVGNNWNILTKNINFHKRSLGTLLYPFKIIYSVEARRKMRQLLHLFKPDIVHLNNINFQLTPSIIYEVKKQKIPLFLTAHDYQWVCPNHMLYDITKSAVCEKCLVSGFTNCIKNNCVHGSKLRSILGCIESALYHGLKTYSLVDKIICSSKFLENKFLTKEFFRGKTTVLYNFTKKIERIKDVQKKDYVLYFGRYSREKGLSTLLEVCKRFPGIQFVFAGGGPVESWINDAQNSASNIKNIGFQRGNDLIKLISEARFTVYPSEWYDNCPFSVIESQMYGTPVIGAEIGGIPEILYNGKTGLLFQAANADDMAEKIATLWNDRSLLDKMTKNCLETEFETSATHGEKVLKLYNQFVNWQ